MYIYIYRERERGREKERDRERYCLLMTLERSWLPLLGLWNQLLHLCRTCIATHHLGIANSVKC